MTVLLRVGKVNTIPILFTFDTSLEVPAGVCLTSLLTNAAPETFYDIFILHGPQCDFSSSPIHRLPDIYGNCRLTFRKVEGEFMGAYQIRGIPETAYYRLISPELIPEYEQFLYSDVDVIFREDLSGYYAMDLEDYYFAGVDTCSALRPDYQVYLWDAYKIDYRQGYYYSGNLVINAEKLLADGKLNEFRALGRHQYNQQDMTIINLACGGKILPLSPSFCMTVPLFRLINERREEMDVIYGKDVIEHALKSGIVHYNGPKPWKEPCLNMDLWWEYYRKSIFFSERDYYNFWNMQSNALTDMPLLKRIKQLLRYPADRKNKKP